MDLPYIYGQTSQYNGQASHIGKIRGRASRFFIMLVQPGKWYFQSQ